MAKSTRFFTGTDSFGRGVDVAQRVDGIWFARSEKETNWGNQMSKWAEHEEPTFESHGKNEYSGESFEYDKPQMFWGFNKLDEIEYKGARLPN